MFKIELKTLMRARTENIIRLANWLGACVPPFECDGNVCAWHYHIACNVLRTMKRARRFDDCY